MNLAPTKHQQAIAIGPKQNIKVPFGLYADFDMDTGKLVIRCRGGSNTIMCVHALGKTEFTLAPKYKQMLLDSVGTKFKKIKSK